MCLRCLPFVFKTEEQVLNVFSCFIYAHMHIYQALKMAEISRFLGLAIFQEENGQNYNILFWLHCFLKWFAHLLKQVYTSGSMEHLAQTSVAFSPQCANTR